MKMLTALIGTAVISATLVSPVLGDLHPKASWEWLAAGGDRTDWHRDGGPIVVAEFPGGRLPPVFPIVLLDLSNTAAPTTVRWRVADPSRVQLSDASPGSPMALPTTSAVAKFALPRDSIGPSAIMVSIGHPYNDKLEIPTYSYAALSLGCEIGMSAGIHFDVNGVAHNATLANSDLYETGPRPAQDASTFYACPPGFVSGAEKVLHIPGGGLLISLDIARFPWIHANAWHPQITQVNESTPGPDRSILIFRLKDGRIGKVLRVSNDSAVGAYTIAPANRDFDDARFTLRISRRNHP